MDEFLIWLLAGLGVGLMLGGRAWLRHRRDAALAQARADTERVAALAEAQRAAAARAEAERAAVAQVESDRMVAAQAGARRVAEAAAQAAAERQVVIEAIAETARLAKLQAEADRAAEAQAQARRAEAARAEAGRIAAAALAEAESVAAARAEAQRAAAAAQAEVDRLAAATAVAATDAAATAAAAQALRTSLAPTTPPDVPTKPAARFTAKRAEQTLVMVADDSKVVRVKTGRLLALHQYQVCFASDGLDAAQQLQTMPPDVVITDVEMPGMDGFELTRHIRGNPATAHIPVIMITAADDRHREQAAGAGVSVLLGKPYPEDALIDHIRLAMGMPAPGAAAPAGRVSENGARNALA